MKNQKIFNKLEEYFKLYNTNYKHIELQKIDLIIPFDKFYFKPDFIQSLFLEDLIDDVEKFVRPYKLNFNQILYVYMNTINYLMNKYKQNDVYNLLDTFAFDMNNVLNRIIDSNFFAFKILKDFMFIERYKDSNFQDIESEKRFISAGQQFFLFNLDAPAKLSETEYDELITKKLLIYYQKMKDTYKPFFNILQHYILTYHEEDHRLNHLYNLFIFNICTYPSYDNINLTEECLIYFAKNNLCDESGLNFLKIINSSYIDEYSAMLLMKELKENT